MIAAKRRVVGAKTAAAKRRAVGAKTAASGASLAVLKDGLICLNHHGHGLLVEGTHQTRGITTSPLGVHICDGCALKPLLSGIAGEGSTNVGPFLITRTHFVHNLLELGIGNASDEDVYKLHSDDAKESQAENRVNFLILVGDVD